MQTQAAGPGPPVRPARLIPERPVELPRHPVVAALEQRGGVDPGVQDAVPLAGRDHPGADQGRVRLLGEPGTLRLLPGTGRVVRQVDPRTELPVGDAREVPARPRIADRELDRAARERASHDVHLSLAIAAQHEQPLPGPDQELRRGPTGDGTDHLEAILARDAGVAVDAFAPEEDRDVLTDPPSVVEDPAAEPRVRAFEAAQHVDHRAALDGHLATTLGQLAERGPQSDDRHRPPSVENGGRRSPSAMKIELPPSRFADLDGPVYYVEWDGPPGRTFVLVHGLGGSLLSWLAVAPGLARHGRVLAMDLPGFGRTERNGRRSRVRDLRGTLSRFVDEVAGGGPVVLVGNSMGGAISMLEAALEPAAVEALVLSNSVFPWKRGSSLPAPIVVVGFALYELPRVGEWASRQRITRLEAERAVGHGETHGRKRAEGRRFRRRGNAG